MDQYASAGREEPVASRLVVMSGMGGLGKTTLALRWSHQVASQFPGGQLYLDLRGHAAAPAVRPIEALAHLLRGLGFEPARIPTELDTATAAYRTAVAGRSVLVVLDNAADAAQVRPLLPGGPGCLTLVTSRNRLAGLVARDGAYRLALDTLTTDEAIALLESILGPGRAAAEADAVAALADLCARLPLALRIAAGFLTDNPHHTVQAYVDLLRAGNRLEALRVDGDDDAAIHATFDLSYQRLATPERRLFRLLGLVPGIDVTAEAAAALAGATPADVGRQLARLCATHLVTEHAPGRYTLHDLLREYARHRAGTDEPAHDRAAALDRLLAWYYLRTRAADVCLSPTLIRLPRADVPDDLPAIVPPADTDAALAWFTHEGANLRSAITHCAEHGPHRWAWLIAELERHHLRAAGNLVDHLTVTRAAVAAAEHCGDPAALTSAHLGYADSLARRDPARARDVLVDAIGPAERADDPLWLASILNDLAGAHVSLGEYDAAHAVLHGALDQKRRARPTARDAATLTNLGILAAIRGNLRDAADHLRVAAQDYSELGAARKEAFVRITQAEVTHALGGPGEALALLDRATALAQESGSYRSVEAQIERSAICTELGRLDEAEVAVATLVAAAEGTHDHELISRAYAARGAFHHRLGDEERALHNQVRAVQVATGSKDQHLSMCALVRLARTESAYGLGAEAREHAGSALGMARPSGARIVAGDALTVLSAIERQWGNLPAAVARADAALAVHRRTGHHLGTARALRALGLALREEAAGDEATERAESCLREAYDLFVAFGSPEAEAVRT